MNIFFTSDQHYNHDKIIQYCNRPFTDVDEMNTLLVENHNRIVKPKDTVYMLGDLAFHYNQLGIANLLSRLNGKKIWILGNHDQDIPVPNCEIHWRMLELKGGVWGNAGVTLSHFPMLSWNRSFHGALHLHGHTHGSVPFDTKVRRLDVGVDCWDYKPVEWSVVRDKLLAVPTPRELAELEKDEKSSVSSP